MKQELQAKGSPIDNADRTDFTPIAKIKAQVSAIQETMRELMKEGEHYGVIPGLKTDKPSLFKAGAEKICLLFRLNPHYDIEKTDLEGAHREYMIRCTLYKGDQAWGAGVGICSTMEKKYRFAYGKPHTNIQDNYNTVLKMAKKRAMVDAVLTATAASDIFTQDIEDIATNQQIEAYRKEVKDIISFGKSHDINLANDAPGLWRELAAISNNSFVGFEKWKQKVDKEMSRIVSSKEVIKGEN